MILLLPPRWLLTADKNNYQITQQDSIQISTPEKPPQAPRLYQGILITKEGLTEALEADFTKYGIEDQLERAKKVIQCESGFRVDPPHNDISYGVAQFTPATWKDFGYGDIMNPYSQLDVLTKMWSRGLQRRWDCYRMGL